MHLSRAASLLVVLAASSCALGADPKTVQVTSTVPSVAMESVRLVPWFTGATPADKIGVQDSKLPDYGRLLWRSGPAMVPDLDTSTSTCLKLRTYRVKRQERFAGNERAFRGYTTCQLLSNYQVRTAVGSEVLQVPAK
jgi:hypothetical protein